MGMYPSPTASGTGVRTGAGRSRIAGGRRKTSGVERRGRIGDWEGDAIIGKGKQSALLTLVERKTLYTVIIKLNGKQADALAQAANDGMTALKDRVSTITFDNGLEFAAHEKMAEVLEGDIFFANPYCSWERGANENTNGLIRQYFS